MSLSAKRACKRGIISSSISMSESVLGFCCNIAAVRSQGPGPTSRTFVLSRVSHHTIFSSIFGFLRKFCQRCFFAFGIMTIDRLFVSITPLNERYFQIFLQNYPRWFRESASFREKVSCRPRSIPLSFFRDIWLLLPWPFPCRP